MKTVIYIAAGIIAGGLFFIFGEMEDAPGLCLMGIIIAFLLGMRGIWHTKLIRKGLYVPLVLLVFGLTGIVMSNVLMLDHEISAAASIIGNFISVAITTVAVWKIRRR